jgi:hypothetical protein
MRPAGFYTQRLFAAGALMLAVNSHAQVAGINYVATELPRPEWPQDVQIADMDGDGLLDVVAPFWSADAGRQLHIYLQQADHRFPAQPSRLVDIRSEIVAVAMADVLRWCGRSMGSVRRKPVPSKIHEK